MLKLTNLDFSETLELGNRASIKGGDAVDITGDLSIDIDLDIDDLSVDIDSNPNLNIQGITGVYSPCYYLNIECSVIPNPYISEVSGSLFAAVDDGPIYLNV